MSSGQTDDVAMQINPSDDSQRSWHGASQLPP